MPALTKKEAQTTLDKAHGAKEFIIIGKYKNQLEITTFQHICGRTFKSNYHSVLHNHKKCDCQKEKRIAHNKGQSISKQDHQRVLDNKYGKNVYTIIRYINVHSDCIVRHEICGNEFRIHSIRLLQKKPSEKCGCFKRIRSASTNIGHQQQRLNSLFGKKEYTILKYKSYVQPITIKHKCGKISSLRNMNALFSFKCKCQHKSVQRRIKFDLLLNNKYKVINTKLASKYLMECIRHKTTFYTNPIKCIRFGKIFGCPKCSRNRLIVSSRNRVDYIAAKKRFLKLIKRDSNFELIEIYKAARKQIKIKCIKHNKIFVLTPKDIKYEIAGCSKCKKISIPERQMLIYTENLLGKDKVVHNPIWKDSEGILKPDIVIPSLKIIIEHHGLYYNHTAITGSDKDDKWKHYNRRKRFEVLGYRLIQIWGDDWIKRKPIIKRYLKAQLCADRLSKWDARKLEVKLVSFNLACRFINKYHPQGQSYGNHYCLGLFDTNTRKIIAVMTFSETSRPVLNKPNTAELTRYASRGIVRGGASRLLVHYLRQNPHIKQIISFSDNDYFNGQMYEAIGFKYDGEDPPTYFTIWNNERKHKSFTKRSNLKLLNKKGLLVFKPKKMTEISCLNYNGVRRCWNSGKKRWIYNLAKG